MKTLYLSAALAAVALAAPASASVTITFDELAHTNSTPAFYDTVTSMGFIFTGTRAGSGVERGAIGVWSSEHPFNADPAGAALFSDGATNVSVTVTRDGGGAFDLASIDLTDINSGRGGTAGHILFSFTTVDGTSSQLVDLDRAQGLRTFAFNRTGLLSFSYMTPAAVTGLRPSIPQIDNVVVEPLLTAAVPEPASWAMMIGGFGVVGAAMRRRKPTLAATLV